MEFDLTQEELNLFLQEAEEQLEILEEGLVTLEESPGDTGLLNALFRAAHTLKGGAATVGFEIMAGLTHVMESLLDALRQGDRPLTKEMADSLFEAVDLLKQCIASVRADHTDVGVDVQACVARMRAVLESDQPASGEASPGEPEAGGDRAAAETGGAEGLDFDVPEGHRAAEWVVRIDSGAAMPNVRAYQVLMEFEELGTVVRAAPSADQLEAAEAPVDTVRVTLVTSLPFPQVRDRLHEIPEVAGVEWREIPTARPERGKGDAASAAPARSGQASTVRIGVDVLDRLMNLVGELVIERTRLAQLALEEKESLYVKEELEQVTGQLSRITTDLQDTVMRARMMPVDTLFRKFPRMVRDLSKQLGKPVNFEVYGEETELDRSVIEQISDPLIHLIRNAVDHGIERPDVRRAMGKPEKGRVTLRAYHEENHIFIEVSDDGRGIDADQLRRSAVEKGVISEEQAARLSRQECIHLIFAPGFSTADAVSTVSGRGVGLDVVRRNIEKVSGSVTVETQVGQGTTFRIKLPLTLAIIHVLMVVIAGGTYAIPLSNVVEGVRVSKRDVNYARGWPMIRVRGSMVPLLDPGMIWGEASRVEWAEGDQNAVVVLQSGSAPIGLRVDRFIGEQEVVVKSMGPIIGRVPGLSGASILGDGRVALIVDVASLLKEIPNVA